MTRPLWPRNKPLVKPERFYNFTEVSGSYRFSFGESVIPLIALSTGEVNQGICYNLANTKL